MLFSNCLRQAFLSLAFFLLVSGSASAGSLIGTVTEIENGNTFTIICLKRPLKIRLMASDAPDKEQRYGDVARQHLSDLILNQLVVVEFSALGDNTLIVGRVFLKEMDVGAQMIRDGVAWYDKKYDGMMDDNQREIYAASELAARTEHRGIWQDQNPVSPWEFREARRLAELSKVSPSVPTPPVVQTNKKP